ncbi:dihydrolipoyl dehydrogenase [Desulfovibrio sp. JC022]|uniref:dihydrolipoyl dehydrogenase n=1 Tax=Desulfovibrio sp. JC022 TaxID=2593642 RepID=UPI0013D3E878|nr:dihydrolipoyl dehydrogenase [Desulfovibrio sp. JC022]NDV22805.1 dihydrolipoyl dehydrogenase [Desulfovibrio sp. JC022]
MPSITIIGSGPGGHIAAFDAARRGAEVTLVEKADMGGTCLNTGCIPTKTLKSSAEVLETAGRFKEFGIAVDSNDESVSFEADMEAVVARKERVRKILGGGLEKSCASLNIRVVRGTAELGPDKIVLVHTEEGTEEIKSDNVIIATGSNILGLPSLPVDHKNIINSDDALDLDHVPEKMIVVGGGVIGCELAFIYRAFGSEVTIVEGMDRLLPVPSVDKDMSKLLQREAKKHRIKVQLAKTVQSAEVVDGKVQCVLGPSPFVENAKPGETTIEADVVLVAVGRTPNTEGLKLAEAGVETDGRGWIKADANMRTSAQGIYAIGDILGPSRIMLAHVASHEGLCAVDNCLGKERELDYSVIPSGIFTSPEIGTVGISEAEALEKGIEFRSQVFQFRELGKAQAMGELAGMFKIICEKESGKILGAHIAGAHATDLIAEAALAIEKGLTAADVAHTIHAHPTLAEGFYEVCEAWLRGC